MTKPMKDLRCCPAPGCEKAVPAQHFCCRRHLFQLPRHISTLLKNARRHRDHGEFRRGAREAILHWYGDILDDRC